MSHQTVLYIVHHIHRSPTFCAFCPPIDLLALVLVVFIDVVAGNLFVVSGSACAQEKIILYHIQVDQQWQLCPFQFE